MATLAELQKFCKNKSIIIVGNSSRILQHSSARLIDSYDIVVRINRGYQISNPFSESLGTKTNILSIGIKSEAQATHIISANKVNFILSPIIWSDKLTYPNVYNIEPSLYHQLKEDLGGFKPSTGISTFNFFHKLTDYRKLDLIGFDFFETSTLQRNELGHLKVNDHNGKSEEHYINTCRSNDKITIYNLSGSPMRSNIPVIKLNR